MEMEGNAFSKLVKTWGGGKREGEKIMRKRRQRKKQLEKWVAKKGILCEKGQIGGQKTINSLEDGKHPGLS